MPLWLTIHTSIEPHLAAGHLPRQVGPEVVTHSAPLLVVAQLQATLVLREALAQPQVAIHTRDWGRRGGEGGARMRPGRRDGREGIGGRIRIGRGEGE